MKRFIYVAGMDYDFKGVDFRIFANNRMKRRINSNAKAKDELEFTIFDVKRGEIATNTVTYPKGVKTQSQAKTTPSKSVDKSHYDQTKRADGTTRFTFKTGQRDKMSVLDVYKAVQDIGNTDAGSLIELSFFSHAWFGGPILVNSLEASAFTAGTDRDPDDMDPRSAKDFIAPTMDAAKLALFQKAFNTDAGFVWIWGCTFPRPTHEILHKVENNSKYKATGVGDDEMFTFKNFGAEHIDQLESWLSAMPGVPFPDKKKVEIKFKWLKHFFCLKSTSTYIQTIATQSKVKTFGANVGTYAEYDTGVPLPLMNVFSGFGRHFTFYKNYLGFAFDPEGRRYAEYKPGFTCTAPKP